MEAMELAKLQQQAKKEEKPAAEKEEKAEAEKE